MTQLLSEMNPHKEVVAFVDEAGPEQGRSAGTLPVIDAEALQQWVDDGRIAEIVTTEENGLKAEVHGAVATARECGIDVIPMQAVYEELLRRLPLRQMDPTWTAAMLDSSPRAEPGWGIPKRAVDLAAGCIGCTVVLLLLPILSFGVWLDVGRPIFFRQKRLGFAGRPFWLIKFRTMSVDAERDGPRWASVSDPRASGFGRFLRRSRLDELPQFWHVLRGDMSLVGPRPERPEFVAELVRHIPCYQQRLLVKPGLTGWAQVNYGYASTVNDMRTRLEYDLYYVRHRSLWLDAETTWRTAWTMLTMSGR